MPLLIGDLLPPPPLFVPTPTRAWDYTYASWIDPAGVEWPLTNPQSGAFLEQGVAGIGSVPITMTSDLIAGGGSVVRSTRSEARIITLPLAVSANTHREFVPVMRAWEDAFTRTTEDGPGMLRIVRPDGTERRILGRYQGGFEPGAGDDWIWNVYPIQLYCEDGYFTDPDPIKLPAAVGASGSPFLGPGYPRTSSSSVLGAVYLNNPGQVPAFATWTINGPFSTFTASLLNSAGATVAHFEINPATALTSAHKRVITTTRRGSSIVDETGAGKLKDLVLPGSTYWSLPRGISKVVYAAVDEGAGTFVSAEFSARYKLP